MRLDTLRDWARDKTRFVKVADYLAFAERFLEFSTEGFQATIISQNEPHYCFWQYRADGHHNITRPINANLMYGPANGREMLMQLMPVLDETRSDTPLAIEQREVIRRSIYTLQQCIGAALDSLPAGEANAARKINGDLFERLVRLLIGGLGIDCVGGNVKVPVKLPEADNESFVVNYQHDLILREDGAIKGIGSVKTSSKDRLDKIFVDKFLYSRLTERDVPHFAICLNDVQRKKTRSENCYGVNATFLSGRFKAYTIRLNPLDGVYYCDLRPNMASDSLLKRHIRTIDCFFCEDLWSFVRRSGDSSAEVQSARIMEGPPE